MGVIGTLTAALEALLDTVAPQRIESARTKKRAAKDIPLVPTSHELLGKRVMTIMNYRDPAVRDMIRALKYDGSRHAARLAADVLADFLQEEIAAARAFSPRRILLVPIPLHASRARERGFNQIELVVHALPKEFQDGTFSASAAETLVRVRATTTQTHLSRGERIKNVSRAFEVRRGEDLRDAHVILIDDVTTTGATLVNASAPLRAAGAQVTLLALARA